MRLARVSRIPDASQNLAASYAISCFHVQATLLQVHIVCELPTAKIERDGIAGQSFQGYWHGGAESFAARDILRNAILRRNDFPISNSQHILAICVIGAIVESIPRKFRIILHLHPIDRVPPIDKRLTIEDDDSAAVI